MFSQGIVFVPDGKVTPYAIDYSVGKHKHPIHPEFSIIFQAVKGKKCCKSR
jgi:hypothetical protein